MKKRKCYMDRIVYLLLCVGTFGIFYFLRVLHSEAIRHAFEDECGFMEEIKGKQ